MRCRAAISLEHILMAKQRENWRKHSSLGSITPSNAVVLAYPSVYVHLLEVVPVT